MNMWRRPRMSLARSSSSPPNVSGVYPFITQDRLVDEKCRRSLDVRQRDVHHGRVEDDHELRAEHMVSARFGRPCRGSVQRRGDIHVGTHLSVTSKMREDSEVHSGYYTETGSV